MSASCEMPSIGKELDLSRAAKHEHADIELDKYYLVLIGESWFMGKFSRVWFGLTFYPWHSTHYQFDAPGSNGSDWKRVIELTLPV